MPTLFLSYSRKDTTLVEQLEAALLAHGHTVWRDVESIRGGANWPKAMGEAIAAHDYVVLAWSQHTATSHFVEFEWSTAVALRKTIVPCLLDATPLPPSLAAKNGIPFQNFASGVSALLEAVQQPVPAHEPVQQARVLAQLQTIKAKEPEQVVAEMRTWLTQHASNVQGPVYQAGRDVHVTIAPPTEEPKKKLLDKWQTWVGLIGGVLAIVLGVIELREKITPPRASLIETNPAKEPEMSYLRVLVTDAATGAPLPNVKLRLTELPVDTVFTGITTSDGGYHFQKLPAPINTRVRVYAESDGYHGRNEYTSLPGPLNLKLEKIK